jgi:hypothetical protein
MILQTERTFYALPGPMTSLAAHARRIALLPDDPHALAKIVSGLLLHDSEVDPIKSGASARMEDRNRMDAKSILDRILQLDPDDLETKRPEDERMVGYCYHFALLLCAFLRAKGTPSRARCGFVNYFDMGKWIDHWVTEYTHGDKWQLVDPQIVRDVSRSEFQDGGTAWLQCRSGQAEADTYGIGELWGWDELRGSLINDLGAINKTEYGNWDWCDLIDVENKSQPRELLDSTLDPIAEASAGEAQFDNVRQLFAASPKLQPPVKSKS